MIKEAFTDIPTQEDFLLSSYFQWSVNFFILNIFQFLCCFSYHFVYLVIK